MYTQSLILTLLLIFQTHSWCFKTSLSIGNQIIEVDWSHDDSTFITITKTENLLRIFDAKTYELLSTYQHVTDGTVHEPISAKISKDSTYIAVGYSNSDVVILYNTPPFNVYFVRATGRADIMQIDFNYGSNKLVSCHRERRWRRWDIPVTGAQNGSLPSPDQINVGGGGDRNIISCQWGPNGQIVISNRKEQLRMWHPGNNSVVTMDLGNSNGDPFSVDFLPLTNTILSVTQKGRFMRNHDTPLFTQNPESVLKAISVGKSSKNTVFGGNSKTLYIYDQSSPPVLLARFRDFTHNINTVKISKQQDFIIVGTSGGQVRIYSTTCQLFTCGSGQFVNQTGSCQRCVDRISFCVTCKSVASCELCVPGYFKQGTRCKACFEDIQYCLQCLDSNSCLKCLDGYYLDSSTQKCLRCPKNGCIECNTSLICTKCFNHDYFLNTTSNSCQLCQDTLPYCVRCFDQNNCSDCQIGFYKNSSKKCTQCPGNCLACQAANNCTECKVGYFASGGLCYRCTNAACISCNQTGVCYDCKEGTFLVSNTCTACTPPCSTCRVAANQCTGCNIGHYLRTSDSTCVKCIENCRFCNQHAKCLSCFPGFKVDGTSFTCAPCSNDYDNCSECTQTQCIKCRDGYWIDTTDSNVCKSCISQITNCMSCINDTSCLQCSVGYFHTGNTGSTSCKACVAGCQECISQSNCTNCFTTFWKNGLVCEACKNNCFECSSDVMCKSCVVGFYLDVDKCKACQAILPHCSACTNPTTCISCMSRSYLDPDDNSCKLCSLSNCLTCNKTSCYSCKVGFYLDTTATPNLCVGCSQFCQECTSSNVCSSCIDGYFFDSSDNNKCKPCAVPFPHCTLCNITNCLSCDQGTEINTTNNNFCTPCNSFITNCKTCFWDNTATTVMKCTLCNFGFGLTANNLSCPSCSLLYGCIDCKSSSLCIKCQIGFHLKNDNTCELCAQNCLSCNSGSGCLACKQGYVFDGTGCVLCQTKIGGCSKCIQDTGTTFNCTYCQIGYFLSTTNKQCNICHQTIKGCYTCNDSSTCTACLDKYFLDPTATPNCQKCSSSIPGCQICKSSEICLSCQDSYFIDPTNNKCKFCLSKIPGCLHCKNDSVCSQCESGYFLAAGNVCNLCESVVEGCIFCNSPSICIQCRAGYYLNSGDNKCYKCSQPGCNICTQNSPFNCLLCNSKHYLNGNTCTVCQNRVPFCDQCDTTNCYQCEVGYHLASPSSCVTCSSTLSGCSRCVDGNICIQCMSSYFVNSSSQCQECNKAMFGCQNCLNSSTCISCEANFFLNSTNDKCQPCTDITGCLLCRNETICVMCQEKYFMQGSDCTLCSKVIRGCFSCASDTVCIQCQSGYVLDPVAYTCKVNTVEAKQSVEGVKLVTYYVSKTMLKHIMIVQGTNFKKSDTLNITENGMTKLFVEDYTGKEVQLSVLSYEYSTAGNSIIFYTDNPVSQKMEESIKQMEFRRLLVDQKRILLTELNLQVLVKMDESVYRQILPDLDFKGSMTVGYSLNNPEFMSSYVAVQSANKYIMYEIVGMVSILLFLTNYVAKFLCSMPHSRNRSTVLPHIIALKSCCLILYPTHFEYVSFCKGFMIVDLPWLNSMFASQLTNISDKVQVPFGLFFQNMNIAGTFLLGFIVYLTLSLIIQAYFYITSEPVQQKSDKTDSELDSEESYEKNNQFKIRNLEQALGINYDNDQSEITLRKQSLIELLWNLFSFSMCYYSCLSVQGAFLNYAQILTLNGVFYIFGMLLFIYVTIETFYAFYRNFRNLGKVRVYMKACLLSLAHFNPIYMVSVCVMLDMVLAGLQFYVANKPNQLSKYFVLSHFLSSVVIGLMIFISGSLVSLFSTALCLVICFGFEIFIHINEYKNTNKKVEEEEFKMEEDYNSQFQNQTKNQVQIYNFWDLGKNKISKKTKHETLETMQGLGKESQFNRSQIDFPIADNKIQLDEDGMKIIKRDEVPAQIKPAGRRSHQRRTESSLKSNVVEVQARDKLKDKDTISAYKNGEGSQTNSE